MKRVLIACERSGVVRDAFRARGHDAWSCDLAQSDSDEGGYHLEGDVRCWLKPSEHWGLMIAHPPCTHLTVACSRLWAAKQASGEQQEAARFFMALVNAPIPQKCIENPPGYMSTFYRPADQYIQPHQFGHPESKTTGLWLYGLQPLVPTRICQPTRWRTTPSGKRVPWWDNQTASGQNKLPPSPKRAMIRARTYPGIAAAMAQQWGELDK